MRLIIRAKAGFLIPGEMVRMIRDLSGIKILDDGKRMMLVEGPEDAIRGIVAQNPEVTLTPEQSVPIPSPRPKAAKSR